MVMGFQPVNRLTHHLESLFEAQERGVASIQEFLERDRTGVA